MEAAVVAEGEVVGEGGRLCFYLVVMVMLEGMHAAAFRKGPNVGP